MGCIGCLQVSHMSNTSMSLTTSRAQQMYIKSECINRISPHQDILRPQGTGLGEFKCTGKAKHHRCLHTFVYSFHHGHSRTLSSFLTFFWQQRMATSWTFISWNCRLTCMPLSRAWNCTNMLSKCLSRLARNLSRIPLFRNTCKETHRQQQHVHSHSATHVNFDLLP